jgi:phosphoglycolate phosphatase-like HAD superfamily hydrolase
MILLGFDFDYTLVISRKDRFGKLLHALQTFGTLASEIELAAVWGNPFREVVKTIAPAADDELDRYLSHYVRLNLPRWHAPASSNPSRS